MESEIVACILTEACSSSSPASHNHENVQTSTPDSHKTRGTQLLRKRRQVNSTFLAPSNPYQLTNTYARRVAKSTFPAKVDAVTQRVLSGKDHRIKQLENDVGVAQIKICELVAENRLLRSLNKRNNAALSRFQDVEAELPSLLSYHNSEVRSLRERFQKLSFDHREQTRELRSKDTVLQNTREQLVKLSKLSEAKGLKERHELTEKLEDARDRIRELEEQHKTVQRQLMLEKKSFKHQLSREQRRNHDLKLQLEEANDKISNLENKLKTKEKFITDHLTRKEFHQPKRTFASFKTLKSGKSDEKSNTVGSRSVSSRVQTTSTARTSDLQDEEDDVESELSFSLQNMAPSIDSIMNHLNYSSSDTDEEVSQIYRGRPTSVPQLSLNTSASTPWAVDSRTFSIRTSDNAENFNVIVNHSSVSNKFATKTNTPNTYSPVNTSSLPASEKSVRSHTEGASEICNTNVCDTSTSRTTSPVETGDNGGNNCNNESPVPKVDNEHRRASPVDTVGSNRSNSPVDKNDVAAEVTDNYSKEALLAALKAIDSQQSSVNSTNHSFPLTNDSHSLSNHAGGASKKVELMQELFGGGTEEIVVEKSLSTDAASSGNTTQT